MHRAPVAGSCGDSLLEMVAGTTRKRRSSNSGQELTFKRSTVPTPEAKCLFARLLKKASCADRWQKE